MDVLEFWASSASRVWGDPRTPPIYTLLAKEYNHHCTPFLLDLADDVAELDGDGDHVWGHGAQADFSAHVRHLVELHPRASTSSRSTGRRHPLQVGPPICGV